MTTTTRTAVTIATSAGKLQAGDIIKTGPATSKSRTVRAVDLSTSGVTANVTFEDGFTWHPRATKRVRVLGRRDAGGRDLGARADVKPSSATRGQQLGPQPGGALGDAMKVLKRKRKAMAPADIYAVGLADGLFAGLKGKTPVATLQAQLAVATKAGRYVERPEPGRYQLRKG